MKRTVEHKRVSVTHRIHVWYIYLHLTLKSTIHVGKYTSPMDPMGKVLPHPGKYCGDPLEIQCIKNFLPLANLWGYQENTYGIFFRVSGWSKG